MTSCWQWRWCYNRSGTCCCRWPPIRESQSISVSLVGVVISYRPSVSGCQSYSWRFFIFGVYTGSQFRGTAFRSPEWNLFAIVIYTCIYTYVHSTQFISPYSCGRKRSIGRCIPPLLPAPSTLFCFPKYHVHLPSLLLSLRMNTNEKVRGFRKQTWRYIWCVCVFGTSFWQMMEMRWWLWWWLNKSAVLFPFVVVVIVLWIGEWWRLEDFLIWSSQDDKWSTLNHARKMGTQELLYLYVVCHSWSIHLSIYHVFIFVVIFRVIILAVWSFRFIINKISTSKAETKTENANNHDRHSFPRGKERKRRIILWLALNRFADLLQSYEACHSCQCLTPLLLCSCMRDHQLFLSNLPGSIPELDRHMPCVTPATGERAHNIGTRQNIHYRSLRLFFFRSVHMILLQNNAFLVANMHALHAWPQPALTSDHWSLRNDVLRPEMGKLLLFFLFFLFQCSTTSSDDS